VREIFRVQFFRVFAHYVEWLAAAAITSLAAACSQSPYLAVGNALNNTVTEYPLTANGNVAPSATLSGSNTGIDLPFGVASDRVGSLRVGNGIGGLNGLGGSITSYVTGATGNSAPIATISGANSGLTTGVGAVAVDHDGNIYAIQVETTAVTIYARGATGDQAPIATIAGGNTGLAQPVGIAVDGGGKIYVANFSGIDDIPSSVTVYTPGSTGDVAPIATILIPGLPANIAVDAKGTVYVANFDPPSITIYSPGANGNAQPQRSISGSNTGLADLTGIAIDANGNIYVSNKDSYATGTEVPDKIVVFGPQADGNAVPKAIISGAQTGLDGPWGLTVVQPDP